MRLWCQDMEPSRITLRIAVSSSEQCVWACVRVCVVCARVRACAGGGLRLKTNSFLHAHRRLAQRNESLALNGLVIGTLSTHVGLLQVATSLTKVESRAVDGSTPLSQHQPLPRLVSCLQRSGSTYPPYAGPGPLASSEPLLG